MNFDKKSRNMLKINMKTIEKLDLSMLSVFFSEKKENSEQMPCKR